MVVLIVNLTDAVGSKHPPTQVDIYNKTLDPGGTLKIPAGLVDKKIRSLEARGIISIGQVPSWYTNAKSGKGKELSSEEKAKRIASKEPQDLPKRSLSVVENAPKPVGLISDRGRR
jgi:hypothetical protein